MTVTYRIMRSDQEKHDIIKVNHNDRQDAITKLENYLQSIDPEYKSTVQGLSLWALHNNAPCGSYKNIISFESPQRIQIIIQVKRNK